jgi:hypothetical protein
VWRERVWALGRWLRWWCVEPAGECICTMCDGHATAVDTGKAELLIADAACCMLHACDLPGTAAACSCCAPAAAACLPYLYVLAWKYSTTM